MDVEAKSNLIEMLMGSLFATPIAACVIITLCVLSNNG
jgi:hypothetical protein